MSDENIEKNDILTEAIPSNMTIDAPQKTVAANVYPETKKLETINVEPIKPINANSKYWTIIIISMITLIWVLFLRYYPLYQQYISLNAETTKLIIEWVEKYTYPTLLSIGLIVVVLSILVKPSNSLISSYSSIELGTSIRGFIASIYIILPLLLLISWHLDRIRFGYVPLIIGFIGIVVWIVLIFANIVYLAKRTLASRNDLLIVVSFAFLIVVITQLTYLGLSSWLVWRLFINHKLLY